MSNCSKCISISLTLMSVWTTADQIITRANVIIAYKWMDEKMHILEFGGSCCICAFSCYLLQPRYLSRYCYLRFFIVARLHMVVVETLKITNVGPWCSATWIVKERKAVKGNYQNDKGSKNVKDLLSLCTIEITRYYQHIAQRKAYSTIWTLQLLTHCANFL